MDRAYRIGQTKEVIVYRLIMAGSVEEKMYEKQVFKDGVRVLAENGGVSSRYFSSQETTKLFVLGPIGRSLVMERLREIAGTTIGSMPGPSADGDGELLSVHALGITRHDTLYDEKKNENPLLDRLGHTAC